MIKYRISISEWENAQPNPKREFTCEGSLRDAVLLTMAAGKPPMPLSRTTAFTRSLRMSVYRHGGAYGVWRYRPEQTTTIRVDVERI